MDAEAPRRVRSLEGNRKDSFETEQGPSLTGPALVNSGVLA